MTIRNLFNLVNGISSDGDNSHLRSDNPLGTSRPSNFARQGTVSKVQSNGYEVDIGGEHVLATGATDEPIQAGQSVWISKTSEGNWFVHGTIKG